MDDRPTRRSAGLLLVVALLGGVVGSAATLAGAAFVMPSQGERGEAGPTGAQGPVGPPGEKPTEADLRGVVPDLRGTYVIEGPLGCPHSLFDSRTVKIPGDQFTLGETLTLCYISPVG